MYNKLNQFFHQFFLKKLTMLELLAIFCNEILTKI
jgi:hypothetical protein